MRWALRVRRWRPKAEKDAAERRRIVPRYEPAAA
jgi:hypothetical protein